MAGIMNLNDLLDPVKMKKSMGALKESVSQKSGWKEDETIYKPMFGDGGKKNVSTVWILPSKHKCPFLDEEGNEINMHMSLFYEHWYNEGSETVKEICPSSLKVYDKEYKSNCAICKYAYETYPYSKEESEENKKERTKRKKKTNAYVNVFVEKDQLFPEKEGKVYKMKLNFTLYKILVTALKGEKQDEKDEFYLVDPIPVFSILETKPLRIITQPSSYNEKYPSYDHPNTKFFDKRSGENEDAKFLDHNKTEILKVLDQTYDLYETFVKPAHEKIKSSDDITAIVDGLYGTEYRTQNKETDEFNEKLNEEVKKAEEEAAKEEDEELKVGDIPDFASETKTEIKEESIKEEVEEPEDDEFAFNPDEFCKK